MRIFALSHTYLPDAGSVFLADLAARWIAQGHQVIVWTAEQPVPGATPAERIRRPIGLPYDRRSLTGRLVTQTGFLACAAGSMAYEAFARKPPDVLLFAGSPSWAGCLAVCLPQRARVRTIHWVMDLYPEAIEALRPSSRLGRLAGPPVKAALDSAWLRADAVVAISQRIALGVRRRVPGADVRTIPLWAPAGILARPDRPPALRQRRGIPDGAFVVLYQGNLGLAYDFAPVLDCAAELAGDHDIVFAIVGSGAQRSWIEGQVSRRRLANVRLFDAVPVDDLADGLAMGDVHLVSARPGWDGVSFPSKLISSLAAGRPVAFVGPDDHEIAEIIRADGSGVIAPDSASLARQVVRLKNDRAERERQAAAARASYDRRFERERAWTCWDEVLASVARSAAR